MFNNKMHTFDKVAFEDANKQIVGSLTLANGIVWALLSQPEPDLRHYFLAGLLTYRGL